MGNVKVRYLVPRPRKQGGPAWYWVPTRRLKAAGFVEHSLGQDLPRAVELAEALNAKLDAFYAGAPLDARRGPAPGTLAAANEAFQRDPTSWGQMKERTQRDFLYSVKPCLEWAGDVQVTKITRKPLKAWISALYADVERGEDGKRTGGGIGPGNARNASVALQRLLTWCHDNGWIAIHPARKLKLPVPAGRDQVWTYEQVLAFNKAAKEAGHPSMAVAVLLGWSLGQRPTDLRRLTWTAYSDGYFAVRQRKTGSFVVVPALAELRTELATVRRTSTQIVVSEATGRPYRESAFQHEFARIRSLANLPKELQFRDLRHTLATALGAAGCTPHEIQSITGHKTIQILTTYVHPDSTFAENAMAKLEGHRSRVNGERS